MHSFKRIAGLLGAILGLWMLPANAFAQETETADTQAFLVTPLSFVKQTDLDFGDIIPGNSDGEVVMDSAGNVSTTGGIIQIDGTQEPARFWGYGQFLQTVLINVNANQHILTRSGGTETLVMDAILIGSQPPIIINTNPRRFRIVNPDGYFTFTIAGRLQVPSDTVPGFYEGQFALTLEYE